MTAAGLTCFQVPGVPATVQTHSPPSASRQNSALRCAPEVGSPMKVVGTPLRQLGWRRAIQAAMISKLSWTKAMKLAAFSTSLSRGCGGRVAIGQTFETVISS